MRDLLNISGYALVFTCFPMFFGKHNLAADAFFFVFLTTSGLLGLLLFRTVFRDDESLLYVAGMLLGLLIFSFLSRLTMWLPLIVALISWVYWIASAKRAFLNEPAGLPRVKLNWDVLVVLLLSFAYLFAGTDYWEAIHSFVTVPTSNDSYYFTALTESLTHSTYWNTYFDLGSPLNYQFASFIPPAFFSKISGVTGHQSLWAFFMPFYKMVGIFLFAVVIKTLLPIDKVGKWTLSLLTLLLFTLTSINPLNIFHLKFDGFILLASGNFLPGGNPGLTLGFPLLSLIIFFVLKQREQMYSIVLLVIIFLLLLISKIALWFPAMVFFLSYSFFNWLGGGKSTTFIAAIVTLLLSVISYKIYFDQFAVSLLLIQPFETATDFIYRTFKTSDLRTGKVVAWFLVYLVLCFGIRLVILLLPFFKKGQRDIKRVSVSVFFAVFGSVLIMFMVKIRYLDSDGNIIGDGSFDLEQFLRASFILVMLVSTYFVFYLSGSSKKSSKIFLVVLLLYCSTAALGNLTHFIASSNLGEQRNEWRENIRAALMKEPVNGSFCVLGNSFHYRAHDLCADGIGPWWYSGKRGDGSNAYFQSNKNYYRSRIVDSLISGSNPLLSLRKMRNEHVEFLIVAPGYIARLDSIALVAGLKKHHMSGYIYKFD